MISVIDIHAHVIPWDSDRQILINLAKDFPIGSQAYGGKIFAHDIVELPINELFACNCVPRNQGKLNPIKRVLIYVEQDQGTNPTNA